MKTQFESQYLSGGYGQTLIIQGVDLALEPGEWLSLLGPNGSGKSTFLKLLGRVLTPMAGAVLLDGQLIQTQSPQVVARKIALLPQQQQIPQGLTVRELVSLGRAPYQDWWQWGLGHEDHAQVQLALEQTGLISYADRPVEALSGGERQRAFLALALAQKPSILLLDEPTTYLDVRYQLELLELLRELNMQGLTIVTVLHEINLAVRYSRRLAFFKGGRLEAVGCVNQILTVEMLRRIFEVEMVIVQTPVGLQVCPLVQPLRPARGERSPS